MKRVIIFFSGIVLLVGTCLQAVNGQHKKDSVALTIMVLDVHTGEHLPAWITVAAGGDDNINGWYQQRGRKGFPSYSPQCVDVPAGTVTIRAWNHISSEVTKTFEVDGASDTCTIRLDPWLDLHKLGYFSFDSHNHLNGYDEKNRPPFLYPYCAALGVDHLDLGQGWLFGIRMPVGYDSIVNYFDRISTPELSIRFGAETPKLRYGHTWYVNHPGLENPFEDYLKWHDVAFVDSMKSPTIRRKGSVDLRGMLHPKWNPPFVDRLRNRKKGAFAAAAHPTRWWNDGDDQLFPVPNLAADLAFDVLVAGSYDGLVVMGDNKDNIFYQSLWFNLLNLGYRLVPVAETDGNIVRGNLAFNMMTYAKTADTSFNSDALLEGIKKGHTTLSGKALMLLTVDGTHHPGSEFPADGKKHTIDVTVYAEPFEDEYVSFLLLFKNGELVEKIDLRQQRQKTVTHSFEVEETETAWYVVKSYGKNHPQAEMQFDVLAYANECMEASNRDYTSNTGISFTAPVFFNGPDWLPPGLLVSEIKVTMADGSGRPLSDYPVEVWNVDTCLARLKTDDLGQFRVNAPATIDVRFTDADGHQHRKWLFYEYPPLLDIIESIYTLSYLKKYPMALPGQVPWEMFQYDQIKDVLAHVDWQIPVARPTGN